MLHRLRHSPLCAVWVLLFGGTALGADIYVSPSGGGDGSSAQSPTSLNDANARVAAGDTVWLAGGVYSSSIAPRASGTAQAWITYQALDGALPIIDDAGSGVNLTTSEYVVVDGVVARNNQYMGFTNQYTDMCSQGAVNNGHLQFRNVIAEGNGISGIAFFCATGITIERAIVAHNGLGSSWSSGVNIYGSAGGASANVVRAVVAFENIDISEANTDGNGFIMDIGADGVLFENCVGFRNGGSCFRVTKSTNAQFINNTCWNNGQFDEPGYGDEIFFSNQGDEAGAVVRNNLLVASSGHAPIGWITTGFVDENNIKLEGGVSAPFVQPDAADFRLAEGDGQAIDQGSASAAPETDIGFDPQCIKQGAGTFPQCGSSNGCDGKIGWFQYGIDYEYIERIGGVRYCFQPGARDAAPDIGAYEHGAVPIEPLLPPGGDETSDETSSDSSSSDDGASGESSADPAGSAAVGGAPSGTGASPGSSASPGAAGGGMSSAGGSQEADTPGAPLGGAPGGGVPPSQGTPPATPSPPSDSSPLSPGAAPAAGGAGALPVEEGLQPSPAGALAPGEQPAAEAGGCSLVAGRRSSLAQLLLLGPLVLVRARRRRRS